MLSLISQSPLLFILVFVVFIFSLSLHEFAHALVADKLGDPTPRYDGRLTLNPMAHLDPLGTILILFTRIGWGRPVVINPANFIHPRRDSAFVALAGPTSNILIAVLFALLHSIFNIQGMSSVAFYILISYNLGLAFFNLLPIYPLDGYNIVYGFLPFDLAHKWLELKNYGMIILLFLILTGTVGYLIYPLLDFSLQLLSF